MRPGLIALGLAVAFVGGGCQYLLGYDPYGPLPEDWEEGLEDPEALARYEVGTATIAIDGGLTIELPRLASPGAVYELLDGSATFTNDDGWYLQVFDAGTDLGYPSSAYLQLDRIVGTSHWTAWDPSRCIVTMDVVDATAMRGRATCERVRWSDYFSSMSYYALEPESIEGEEPFDAEITFEALPGPSQS